MSSFVNTLLRTGDGLVDGLADVGLSDVLADGRADGLSEGLADGLVDGLSEGLADGLVDGLSEGLADGLVDEHGSSVSLKVPLKS